VAYTPVQPDFATLGSFGTILDVAKTIVPAGRGALHGYCRDKKGQGDMVKAVACVLLVVIDRGGNCSSDRSDAVSFIPQA